MKESVGLIIDDTLAGKRLDVVLTETFPEKTRSHWQRLIDDKKILVNDEFAKKDYIVRDGDPITILPNKITKQPVDLPILYEDDNIIAIDKPVGVLVHAKDAMNSEFTVVDGLRDKIDIDEPTRPGIVHRLDRGTSGVMVIAKNQATKDYLQKQFANRQVDKTYLALVDGQPNQPEAVIKWPIERNPKKPSIFQVGKNGKPAETSYRVISSKNGKSLIELKPKTGRTHQLRVHLAHLGHPIIGDKFYNGSRADRLMLHAKQLEISIAHNDRQTFSSQTPAEFNL